MAQQKRGYKFALSKIGSLLKVIKAIAPIRNPDWEKIFNKHASHYPMKDRTVESMKCKFQELAHTKIPTEDPNMPPHICKAKHIYYKIVQATDRSTGVLEDFADLDNDRDGDFEDDKEDDNEEGGMVQVVNNSFTSSTEDEQLTVDDYHGGSQKDAEAALAVAISRLPSDGDNSRFSAIS
jgi:hypothetical protein